MMRKIWFILVIIFLGAGSTLADTTRVMAGSDVSGLWTGVGSPYIVQGNIRVARLDTLQIGPGVTVYFDGQYSFTVEGTLLSLGAESRPVSFTTDTIDHPTSWAGIRMLEPSGTCRLDYTVIEKGHALGSDEDGLGGGLFCEGARLEMNFCTVRACRAAAGQGIYCRSQSILTLYRCLIRDNGSTTGSGGGIYVSNSSTMTLTDCDIINNTSVYGGGGIIDGSVLVLNGCTFSKNDAINSGGGLYCGNATVTVSNSTFLANTSFGGGAIDGRNNLNLTMDHSLIQSNQASRVGAQGSGGGFSFASGSQRITNCTFVNNTAGTGGAVYAGSSTRFDNCIFAFQTAGGGLYFPLTGCDVRFCCLYNNNGGDFGGPFPPNSFGVIGQTNANGDSCDTYQNLFRDPDFDPSAERSYSLLPDSPCINAGDPQTAHDPDGTVADIGAYYYPLSSNSGASLSLYPSDFHLAAYPNPFNPSTSLTFDVARDAFVSLNIYDILGREVAALVNARRSAGSYTLNWNAGALPSGTYLAVLDAGGARTTLRLLLLK
jgi:hypothetical protein